MSRAERCWNLFPRQSPKAHDMCVGKYQDLWFAKAFCVGAFYLADERILGSRESLRMSWDFNSISLLSGDVAKAALPAAGCKLTNLIFIASHRRRPETHLTRLTNVCTSSWCYLSIRKKNYVQPAINTSGGAWNIMQMMMLHHKSTWRRSRNQQETFSGGPATTSNFHRRQTAFAAGGPSTQCSSGDEAQLTSECGVALATGTRAIQPRRRGYLGFLSICLDVFHSLNSARGFLLKRWW